jgi:putative ABC transport system substrate-binding protein
MSRYFLRNLFNQVRKGLLLGIVFHLIVVNAYTQSDTVRRLAITQFVKHPSLDAVYQALLTNLKAAGFEEGKNLKVIYENANGNTATAAQIAKNFVSLNPDCIVAIATPSAQALVTATRKYPMPIVFAAVTDPIGAKLVSAEREANDWVTGVKDQQPIVAQVKLIQTLLPDLKTLGVLYNPSEINSVEVLKELEKHVQGHFKIVHAGATSTATVSAAVKQLVGRVDAIYIPTDNTVVSALGSVSKTCASHRTPIFSADPELVQRGILASVGFMYDAVGKKVAEQVASILEGAAPGSIPVAVPLEQKVYINTKSAADLNIVIPQMLLENVNTILL